MRSKRTCFSIPLDTSWQQSINVVNGIRPGSTRGVVQHKSIAAQVDKWTLNVSHYRVTWDRPGQFIKGVKVALNASRRGFQRTEQQHMQKQLCWRWQGPLVPILHNGLFYVVLCVDKERITGNHNGTSHLPAFPYLSSQSTGGQWERLGKNVSSQRTGKLHPFKCRRQTNCDFFFVHNHTVVTDTETNPSRAGLVLLNGVRGDVWLTFIRGRPSQGIFSWEGISKRCLGLVIL